ncbi:hypothetical protein ACWDBO_37860 [Streptomyces mirabilis]|uniref:hypothetical protein n=1 Tax=Streptomyces mirabilis TaxID=68239 RepID=UPI0031BB770D
MPHLRLGPLVRGAEATGLFVIKGFEKQAVCASATNRRARGPGLHHVLDGRTGLPTNDILATWVVADVPATALFFAAPDQLAAIHRFAYVRVGSDGRVDASPDFDGEFFT